ncbi:MAG: ABC transporter substrate-binding protein [Cyclobacteriaceae bacterium]|nr:ABC transporter substrate-binding protein [Cyclobacteriaceae bacterium]
MEISKPFILFFLLLFINVACNPVSKEKSTNGLEKSFDTLAPKYADGFNIFTHQGLYVIQISSKDYSENTEESYLLLPKNHQLPNWASDMMVIPWPIESLVTTSASHIALTSVFGAESVIKGVTAKEHIFNERIHQQIKTGHTFETGIDGTLNFEWIVGNPPDLVMLSGSNSGISDRYKILKDAGIPVIVNRDWQEKHILGRAEWVVLMGLLLNRFEEGKIFFENTERNYFQLAALTKNVENKPGVLINNPFKGVWYMPGADSYIAGLLDEAGGNYIWKHLEGSRAHPLDFESVYVSAIHADFWVNPGISRTMQHLVLQDDRFRDFYSVKRGKVYNCTLRVNESGGNDYFEGGVLRPDLVLADLIYIFHPQILPEHNPVYFEALK